jgi:alkanesulfonate monooxygenase SsuD/methylene tetrahydromethanopterin reductase-like flavin-dependent oxidoreductase (luciferase family)
MGPNCSYENVLLQVEKADELALDSVLFEEHHGACGCSAVGSVMAAAATRTSAIRVGSANRQIGLEYPTNVAEDFAIIDAISRGRVILGASAGEREAEFVAANAPWDSREARFKEALELIRTSWTQSNFQFIGDHYRFPLRAEGDKGWRREPADLPFVDQWRRGQVIADYLPLLPQPVQLPHPPIWVNATSRAMIEWAASRGYSLLISSLETEAEVTDKVNCYDTALKKSGRDRNEVSVCLSRELFLAEEGSDAREKALPGLLQHIANLRAEGREDQKDLAVIKGISDEDLLSTCALYGSYDELIDRLVRLKADCGINHLICRSYLPGRSHVDLIDSIKLLSSQIHTRLLA